MIQPPAGPASTRGRRAAAALVPTIWLAGCAAFQCAPATIVVADTQLSERLASRLESIDVDPVTGRMREIYRDVVDRSYWVRAADGEWIAVDEATWRQAEKGKPLAVCR